MVVPPNLGLQERTQVEEELRQRHCSVVVTVACGCLRVLEGSTGITPAIPTVLLPQGGEVGGLLPVVLQRPLVAALAATGADGLRILVEEVEATRTAAYETGQAQDLEKSK